MHIEVDRDLCEANGTCEVIAPELFRVDDDEELELLQAQPPAALVDAAKRAVDSCPRAALELLED
ncbi:ferredoxin [Nitriliruptor alkaliphilus]|uniref:ferredoxin n=1 Tax=Nitriliruptor alkaliphilus TaxID=427918 RepID=UPI000695E43F|nr:ferredoxin [Nitriliruptor alkaliphilus]